MTEDQWPQRKVAGRLVRRRIAAIVVAIGAGWVLVVPAAWAHPFGPPLAADVSVDQTTVRVRIVAAEDDWVILGDHTDAFRNPAGAALDPEARLPRSGAEALASAPALRDYLVDHVRVAHLAPSTDDRDRSCPGEVTHLTPQLGTEGVELSFHCDNIDEGFAVTSTLMTDIHEAYRTAIRGHGTAPSRAMLTQTQPSVQMVDDPTATTVTTVRVVPLLLIMAGVGVIGIGLTLLIRQSRVKARAEGQTEDRGAEDQTHVEVPTHQEMAMR